MKGIFLFTNIHNKLLFLNKNDKLLIFSCFKLIFSVYLLSISKMDGGYTDDKRKNCISLFRWFRHFSCNRVVKKQGI